MIFRKKQQKTLKMNKFIEKLQVSKTKNAYSSRPEGVEYITALMQFKKLKNAVEGMRALSGERQKKAKLLLPCFFNCKLKGGTTNDHAELTTIIIIDADGEANKSPAHKMFKIFQSLPYVAAVAYSIRGAGVYAVIRIRPTSSNEDFHRIAESLESDLKTKGIIIDPSCKNIARKRFYGYTDRVWFNPEEPTTYKPKAVKRAKTKPQQPVVEDVDGLRSVEDLVNEIEKNGISIAEDYADYLNTAFAFANAYGEAGRDYFHRVCGQSEKYSFRNADKKYNNALQNSHNRHTIRTFYYQCKQAAITVSKTGERRRNQREQLLKEFSEPFFDY